MRRSGILFITVSILLMFACARPAAAEIRIGNGNVARVFDTSDGAFGTVLLENGLSGEKINVTGPEFEITLMDGTVITSDEMQSQPRLMEEQVPGEGAILDVQFTAGSLVVMANYHAPGADGRWMKKKIEICNNGSAALEVDSVAVEAHVPLGVTERHGGLGQPLFFGDFFTALESPAGHNDVKDGALKLVHYPGWKLAPGKCGASFTAVLGAGAKGGVEEAFKDYVDSIRYSKQTNLHYNSWYDVREEGMSVARFEEVFNGLNRGLDPHGVTLDYLVVDDGWQKRDSIWESSAGTFPDGFAPLRDILEAGGTRFGLWMPLPGVGLDVAWGKNQGFEAHEDAHHYCLAGPKYNAALRARIAELVEVEGVRYFKHDFNYFNCFSAGVDYPQTERHSFEANVNAELGLLDYIHSVNPEVFLNVTSNMWLSPWWLGSADAIWMGSGDYGYEYGAASLEPRDWAMTYRDAWLYRRLALEGARFPMNAIMTHGIIDGARNRLGGENEKFRTWADNVVLYFGRGVYMRELYISPELMDARKWEFLADAAKWAAAMDAVFARTEWVGGDPRIGQSYGYHHYGAGQDWYVLRNPGMEPITLDLPRRNTPGTGLRQVYPRMKYITGENKVALNGHDVLVLSAVDAAGVSEPAPLNVEYEVLETKPGETRVRVYASNVDKIETTKAVTGKKTGKNTAGEWRLSGDVYNACRVDGEGWTCKISVTVPDGAQGVFYAGFYSYDSYLMGWVEINGARVSGAEVGKGWRLFAAPVGPETKEIVVRVPFAALLETPFASRVYQFRAFLEAETGAVAAAELTLEHAKGAGRADGVLPPARDPGRTRLMRVFPADARILLEFGPEKFGAPAPVTEKDLEGVTAAKLRIRVFGSSGYSSVRTMLLNGSPVAMLPVNGFPYDFWQEFAIDLPPNAVRALKMKNRFVVNNLSDDAFKFKDVGLAVRLADGAWRETNLWQPVQSSAADWEFTEGPVFSNQSKPIPLSFE